MTYKEDPLKILISLEKEARDFGFVWPNSEAALAQSVSECKEISDAIKRGLSREILQTEIGDLIHSAISLCVFSGFDVFETIAKINNKFGKRISIVKQLTREYGLENLHGKSTEFMLKLWAEAKELEDKY